MFTSNKSNVTIVPSNPIVQSTVCKTPKINKTDFLSELLTSFSFGVAPFMLIPSKVSPTNNVKDVKDVKDVNDVNDVKDECKHLNDVYQICMNNKDISDCKYLQVEYNECLKNNN